MRINQIDHPVYINPNSSDNVGHVTYDPPEEKHLPEAQAFIPCPFCHDAASTAVCSICHGTKYISSNAITLSDITHSQDMQLVWSALERIVKELDAIRTILSDIQQAVKI